MISQSRFANKNINPSIVSAALTGNFRLKTQPVFAYKEVEVDALENQFEVAAGIFFAGGMDFWANVAANKANKQPVVPALLVDTEAPEIATKDDENMYRTYFQSGIERVFNHFQTVMPHQAKTERSLQEIRKEAKEEILRVLKIVDQGSDEYKELIDVAEEMEAVIAAAEKEEIDQMNFFWTGVVEAIGKSVGGGMCGEKFFNNAVQFMRTKAGKAAIQIAAGEKTDADSFIKNLLTLTEGVEFANGLHQTERVVERRSAKRLAEDKIQSSFGF